MNMTTLLQLFGFKTRLAESHVRYDSEFSLFQVWQVDTYIVELAGETRKYASTERKCLAQHLSFPRDYQLVAFIVGKDLDDVLACMKIDKGDANGAHGTWLRSDPMAIGIGDAIVTPDGDVQCVTPCGFCPMQRPQDS